MSLVPGPDAPQGRLLTAANATGPERSLILRLKGNQLVLHQCKFDFITGDVEGAILDIDYLKKIHMTVDPAAAFVRCSNGSIFPGILSLSLNNPVFAALPADIQPIITTFSDICSTKKSMPPPAVGVQHFLQTEQPPVTSRFRHLDSDKLHSTKEIFAAWDWDGVFQQSDSQGSSPLHMVKKKDSSWWPCGDFHYLSLATKAYKYLVPNLGDFLSQLEDCTAFSTLDLKNGYLQVPLEQSAVSKTAIITPLGLFEFLQMPFGLKNVGMTFQWYMDRIFNGLDFIFIYINDILVASKSCKEHIVHLREVLNKLRSGQLAWSSTSPSAPLAAFCGLPWPPGQLAGHPPPGRQGGGPPRPPLAKHSQGVSAVPGTSQLLQEVLPQHGQGVSSPHQGLEGLPSGPHQDPVVGCHADCLQRGQEQPLHRIRAVTPLSPGQVGWSVEMTIHRQDLERRFLE